MTVIAPAKDLKLLADMAKTSFIESHGRSASVRDITRYVNEKYNEDVFKEELNDPKNIYHIIYHDTQPAGYSKIILNASHSNIQMSSVTKLERLYLLKEFYSLKLGFGLLEFNIELSKKKHQTGMWLFVWKENYRAVRFYEKTGFKVIGSYAFEITKTHSNPNHQMLLVYQ